MIIATPRSIAELTLATTLAAVPKYATDWAYIDYDEKLDDDQLANLLSGDADNRAATIEEIDDLLGEKAEYGLRQYMKEDIDPAVIDLLDQHDLDDHLRDGLREKETGDPWSTLIGHCHNKAMRVPTGLTVDPPGGSDENYTDAVTAIREHLVGLGASEDDAQAAAEDIATNQYYGGELHVVWYGEADTVVDKVLEVHHGNAPDEPVTFTWTPRPYDGMKGGPYLVLWDGMNGAGADHRMPAGITLQAKVTDVRPEFRNSVTGWTWCDDCAGIYTLAYYANLTITPALTTTNA